MRKEGGVQNLFLHSLSNCIRYFNAMEWGSTCFFIMRNFFVHAKSQAVKRNSLNLPAKILAFIESRFCFWYLLNSGLVVYC